MSATVGGTFGGGVTVIVTGADVAVLLKVSVALAVRICAPTVKARTNE